MKPSLIILLLCGLLFIVGGVINLSAEGDVKAWDITMLALGTLLIITAVVTSRRQKAGS